MTGEDCIEIGKTAFLMEDFYHSVLWFQAALSKFELMNTTAEWVKEKLVTVYDYLNFSLYKVLSKFYIPKASLYLYAVGHTLAK